MAIVGIGPYDIEYTGLEIYDATQVREILIKFANSKNAMRRDMTVEQIVDEFMESGEQ